MANLTDEQKRKLYILNIRVESEKIADWEEFQNQYVSDFGWNPNDEKQLYAMKAMFIIRKYGGIDLEETLGDKIRVPEIRKESFLVNVVDSVKKLFEGKKEKEDYPPVVQQALNCLGIIRESEKEYEKENKVDADAKLKEIAEMKPRQQTAFLLGNLEQWKSDLTREVNTYARFLSETQKDPQANWYPAGNEGPKDYIAVGASYQRLINTLSNPDASLDSIRAAMADFNSKLSAYERGHRPVFRDHTSPETAERYRLIEGMANLTEAYLKVFDQLKKGIQENAAKFHVQGTKFKAGRNSFTDLKLICGQMQFGVKAGYQEPPFDYDKTVKDGREIYPTMREVAVKKMLNERFERKTGLKTEVERKNLKVLYGQRPARDYAKNYCSVKYRDQLVKTEELMKNGESVKEVIDLNDKIRAKNFNKEVDALAEDFYFKRIIANHPKNWKEKWDEVVNKSTECLDRLKDSLNTEYIQTSEHLAKNLIIKALTDPKNAAALHAYAHVIDYAFDRTEIENVTNYVKNYLETQYPNVNHEDAKTREEYLKKLVNDEGLKKTIAGKVQEFCEKQLFPKLDGPAKGNGGPVL